jgi:phage terminase large subunit-like protein
MQSLGPAWLFDDSEIPDPHGYGERAVRFLSLLKHPKSRRPGKAFTLDPWQERIIRRVYGPCADDGKRIVRTVFLQVGRGNRKTSLGAAFALLHTIGPERVTGGQVVSAAADRKQARIAYEEALGIVAETPALLPPVTRPVDSRNRLVHAKSGSTYEAISADAATQFGRTPSFALVDELWAHKKIDLWHAIRTGLAKVAGSLLVIATTAGRGQETPDFPIYAYAQKVAAGEIEDPSFLPIVFEAPRDADWRDEEIWHAVNPGLRHGYPDLEGLRALAREAEHRPADREAFRQFHLGVRLDHSADPFVDMDVYDAGAEPVDLDALKGEPCWIGVDLSSSGDLTAVVLAFADVDGGFTVIPHFFVPGEQLQRRANRDGVPYPLWQQEGFITATEGAVVDYAVVEDVVRQAAKDFDVREIAFDPKYGQQTMQSLAADGLPVVQFPQNWATMVPAVATLERAIIGRKFRHGGNPVLRWNFENVAVGRDSAGNRFMHKGKSKDRIDGAVACAMAVSRASMGDRSASIFDVPDDQFDASRFLWNI